MYAAWLGLLALALFAAGGSFGASSAAWFGISPVLGTALGCLAGFLISGAVLRRTFARRGSADTLSRVRPVAPGVVSVLMLTSCAGAEDFDSAESIARELRGSDFACSDLEVRQGDFDDVESNVICTLRDGREVQIQIHKDASGVDSLAANSDQILGGTGTGAILHAHRWVLYFEDRATAQAAREIVGGEITEVGS